MKAMKRRLLSLFMAMVMVCSLVPVALAEGESLSVAVTATPNSTVLTAGNTITFTATIGALSGTGSENYEIANNSSTAWSISPANAGATIDASSGAVTISVAGTYIITASGTATKKSSSSSDTSIAESKPYTGNATVTITAATVAVTGVTLNKSTLNLSVGASETLTATVAPADATNKKVTWSSNDSAVASVDQNGKVTGEKDGTATITATTEDGTKTATCTVTVTVTPEIELVTSGTIYSGSNFTVKLKNAPANSTVTWSAASNIVVPTSNTTTGEGEIALNVLPGAPSGNYRVTATVAGTPYTKDISVTSPLGITISPNSSAMTSYDSSKTLTVSLVKGQIDSVNWSIQSGSDYVTLSSTTGNPSIYVYPAAKGTATIRASVTDKEGNTYVATQDVTVNISSDITPSATIYEDNSGYILSDIPDEGSTSVADQIASRVDQLMRGTSYSYYTVRFTSSGNTTNGHLDASTSYEYDSELDDVEFEPTVTLTSSKPTATSSYNFKVFVYNSSNRQIDAFDGTVTFNIKQGTSSSAGDITYTASLGEDVPFSVSDFEDFYTSKYSRGSLDYVTFGSSSSNGTLYNEEGKSAGSTPYYVSPSSRQKGLDGIYFSPKSSMKKSTTVKITFTAYGTTRSNSGEGEVEGTVSILYLNDSASDITYNTTSGKVTLDPKDFENAYKEATGSKTAPSNLTIEFQNVPDNGTLTYTGGSRDKDLTRSNVKSTRYTTKSSGSNRLAQLTYSGTKGKDTISYIAYSGSTAQFTGNVVFNGAPAVRTDVVVGPFYSTGGLAATFNLSEFTKADSAISNATKIRFVAPANGTLTMSGASAAGIDIATSMVSLVSYQPKAGYNNTDQIIFAAYDSKNAVVSSGTVNVQVIGNPTTTPTNPTNPSTGVTDVSQFTDVASNAWYRDNLATLVRKGVISGRGNGKFDPKGTVTYGEALKMVLEACGYTATVGTGSQWAINYKNLAVSRGWISNDIDLNAAISRNATAELAAKVLGVSPVTSGSPFADEANAYAVALYYTTPQVFVGSTNPNGGKPLFQNSSPLLREQVCAVICRVSDYHTQHTTNTMPDGT